jgi:hypothetical protein
MFAVGGANITHVDESGSQDRAVVDDPGVTERETILDLD